MRTLRVRRNIPKLTLYRHFTNTLIFCVIGECLTFRTIYLIFYCYYCLLLISECCIHDMVIEKTSFCRVFKGLL